MIDTIYIEDDVRDHPRTQEICARFPNATRIPCNRYGEIFNRKAQNFRLQKQRPALILARKFKNFVLEAPPGYGIGGARGFYFSHMLNCIYDCRYCFLQGMYRSAYYVLFVNFEDFQHAIADTCRQATETPITFFSGYDCDSLALEPVTGFARDFVPLFKTLADAQLELRTKSTQIRSLLEMEPVDNCIIAYSLSPEEIAEQLEHKAPTLARRIDAAVRLQHHGWRIGLRFDPLIYHNAFREQYGQMFEQVFAALDASRLHSVTLGTFRMPDPFFRNMVRLHPYESMFAGPLIDSSGMVSYRPDIEQDMIAFCSERILQHLPIERFFLQQQATDTCHDKS